MVEEESGTQGSRRPPDGWPSRPLQLLRPPFIPPRGNSRPPAPQNKVCRRRARAFLCSSPVTPPAFSLCRAQARASPAISAAPWTGTALAFLRAAFYSRRLRHVPCCGTQMPRRSSRAVMPFAHTAQAAPPGASRPVHFQHVARQPSSPSRPLHFSFVSESGVPPEAGPGPCRLPAQLSPCLRSRNL